MEYLIGEYEAKLDTKGRMVLPAGLKRQLPEAEREGFIVNRGIGKFLVLNTRKSWDKTMQKMAKLSEYNRKHDEFMRRFMRGSTELFLDGANRLLLPKGLMDYAAIKTDIVISCRINKIEIWAKEAYEALWENEEDDLAQLAEEVMGSLKDVDDE
ncbi:MraZ protein [bacterium A37T11]|nr:MraZ protein [bacterium A37T11]